MEAIGYIGVILLIIYGSYQDCFRFIPIFKRIEKQEKYLSCQNIFFKYFDMTTSDQNTEDQKQNFQKTYTLKPPAERPNLLCCGQEMQSLLEYLKIEASLAFNTKIKIAVITTIGKKTDEINDDITITKIIPSTLINNYNSLRDFENFCNAASGYFKELVIVLSQK